MSMKEVSGPDDVPAGPHFAVIIFKTASAGYPCVGDTHNDYQYFVTTDRGTLEKFIEDLDSADARDKQPYVFFMVSAKGQMTKNFQFEFIG